MLVQSRLEEKLEAERRSQAALAQQQRGNENGAPAGVCFGMTLLVLYGVSFSAKETYYKAKETYHKAKETY